MIRAGRQGALPDILAVGARTPVGLRAESTAAAVRAGVSRAAEFPFVHVSGEPIVAAADPELASTSPISDRLAALAFSAIEEAAGKLPRGLVPRSGAPTYLALPEPRPGCTRPDLSRVVDLVQRKVDQASLRLRMLAGPAGHAGSVRALEDALEDINQQDGLVFIVGADSYLAPETLVWLEDQKLLAGPDSRAGFIPGEGAGCLVLASPRTCAQRGLPALARIGGVGAANEVLDRTSDTGTFGEGLADAVKAATRHLRLPDQGIDHSYADINGERYRSEEWGFMALRASDALKTLAYDAPADLWGDVGAAWAPLATVLAVASYARDYAPGPRTMITAGSYGGLRGAVVVCDPKTSSA